MHGSLEASATSKYRCLVILEVFQGPLKLTFAREWPNGKEAYPITYKKAKRRSSEGLTHCNLLTFFLHLLLKLVENPVLFRDQTTMRLC